MHQLGHTRSARHSDHLLQTPDCFVRAPLPCMRKATAIVHVNSAAGARFSQYTAELEAGGRLDAVAEQRFIYVLDGEVQVGGATLRPGDFAYLPAESAMGLAATTVARAAVIEKSYEPLSDVPAPTFFTGRESLAQFPRVHGGDGNAQPGGDFFQRNVVLPAPGAECVRKAGANIAMEWRGGFLGHNRDQPGVANNRKGAANLSAGPVLIMNLGFEDIWV